MLEMESARRDLRFAIRSLRRSIGFTGVAVLTLAIGIGASTTMFTVLNGVLLQRQPVRDQDHLVVGWLQTSGGGVTHWPVDYRELRALAGRDRAFASVAGSNFQGASELVMQHAGDPVTLEASWVTGDFFSTLGVKPAYGRLLRPSDDVLGAAPVMVISDGFWRRQFGANRSVIGQELTFDGRRYTIVGVLPPGFEYPRYTEAWFAAIPWFPATATGDTTGLPPLQFELVARLRPGIGIQGARTDYQAYMRFTDADRPAIERGSRPVIMSLTDRITGSVRPILWSAAGAAALLLLIACINVANLLLIRGSARRQELAIRTALGAQRGRLLRQLMLESGLLGGLGGLIGLAVTVIGVRALVALAPAGLPHRATIGIDPAVLLFALAITGVAAVLAGLAPAVSTLTSHGRASLSGGGAAKGASRETTAVRRGLVIVQVALALMVAIGAGLLTRTLIALERVDMGFNADRLLVFETAVPAGSPATHDAQLALAARMLARIEAIPGVTSATVLPKLPFSAEGGIFAEYTGEGQGLAAQRANPLINLEVVGSAYFRTLSIPVLGGRAFGGEDREHAPLVAIVSQALARRTWPGENPIGKRIKLGGPQEDDSWLTIVGVVGDTRYHELTSLEPSLYVPLRQFDGPVSMTLAVRTRGDPGAVAGAIRDALRQVPPGVALAKGGDMRALLDTPLARPRFSAFLFIVFGAVTVCLAIVGVYGTLAATVAQRTREIGIRVALGAAAGRVRGLVIGQGVRLVAVGCALGLGGALAATRVLRSMLFGVSAIDPLTIGVVSGVIVMAGMLASYIPARRATRVDPLIAMRVE